MNLKEMFAKDLARLAAAIREDTRLADLVYQLNNLIENGANGLSVAYDMLCDKYGLDPENDNNFCAIFEAGDIDRMPDDEVAQYVDSIWDDLIRK